MEPKYDYGCSDECQFIVMNTLQELKLHGRKICDGVVFPRYSQMILVLFSINDQLAR